MSITQTEEFQRPMRTLKFSGQILLQSIPLMALLFLLFPRSGPLWSVPFQSASGITGLSDEMSPGDIGDLTRSGDVAFTVQFTSGIPQYRDLYWRGITLDRFDGREWSRGGAVDVSRVFRIWVLERNNSTPGFGRYSMRVSRFPITSLWNPPSKTGFIP